MPRYVEIDDVEVSDYVTVWDCNCSEFGKQTVMAVDDLQYLPTADVVPRSEYEAVVSAVDNSTKEFLKLHDDYQEAKREADKWMRRCREWHEVAKLKSQLIVELEAELSKAKIKVAREIFEEIERTCIDSFGCFYIGATHGAFAELKKKYAENENG